MLTYTVDTPYIVINSSITTFGIFQDVPGDGNCFFTAHWQARNKNEAHSSIFYIDIEKKYMPMHIQNGSHY